ncbi:hypothetical protein OFL29_33545, partial [Pseudomonas aeruginosa]|nr:hypothetical protein [Pseudomonas aeruginosa]
AGFGRRGWPPFCQSHTGSGFFQRPASEKDFIFLIGDAPGYPNATYLIDYEEYDPDECDIGFSPCPKERVRILLGILTDLSLLLRAKNWFFLLLKTVKYHM